MGANRTVYRRCIVFLAVWVGAAAAAVPHALAPVASSVTTQQVAIRLTHDAVVRVHGAVFSVRFEEPLRLSRDTPSTAGLVRLMCGSTLLESFPAVDEQLAFFPSHFVPMRPLRDNTTVVSVVDLLDLEG